MKLHFVYKTINLINDKFYIGVHSCESLTCGYLGSGTALKLAIKKHGKDNFSRQILGKFSTRHKALKFEKSLVDVSNPLSYNLVAGGQGYQSLQDHPHYPKT